jgi:hypothetical protein
MGMRMRIRGRIEGGYQAFVLHLFKQIPDSRQQTADSRQQTAGNRQQTVQSIG